MWYRENTHKAMNLRCHRGGHFVDRRGLCGKETRKEHANLKKQVLSLGDNGSRHSLDNVRAGYLVTPQYKTDKRLSFDMACRCPYSRSYIGVTNLKPHKWISIWSRSIDRLEPLGVRLPNYFLQLLSSWISWLRIVMVGSNLSFSDINIFRCD